MLDTFLIIPHPSIEALRNPIHRPSFEFRQPQNGSPRFHSLTHFLMSEVIICLTLGSAR
jgi:hypothetical protein